MKLICPNKNLPEWQELENIVPDMAYNIWELNNGYGIDKAPNGADSILFQSLLDYHNGNREEAIRSKAKIYSRDFRHWFGESKVIDKNNEPRLMFHGTNTDIQSFNYDNFGRTDDGYYGKGIYFTTSESIAGSYARSTTQDFGGNMTVIPVWLNIANPLKILTGDRSFIGQDVPITNDGVFAYYENITENIDYSTEVVAINPNQIKSIDNNGSFSSETGNIYKRPGEYDTPIDESIEIMNKLSEVNDSSQLIDFVIDNSTDKRQINIANAFKELLNNDRISNIPVVMDNSKDAGTYRTITVNGVERPYMITFNFDQLGSEPKANIPTVALHELVHHYTTDMMLNDPRVSESLATLYNQYKELYPGDYASMNMNEFVSELLSNKKTIDKVKEIKFNDMKTWYQRLYELLKRGFNRLFGRNDAITNDILSYIQEYLASHDVATPITAEQIMNLPMELEIAEQALNLGIQRMDSILKQAEILNARAKEGIRNRSKSVRKRAVDIPKANELEKYAVTLDRLDDVKALFEFLRHISLDIKEPSRLIRDFYTGDKQFTNKALVQFKQDYLGFYFPIFEEIQSLNDRGLFNSLPQDDIDFINKQIGILGKAFGIMQSLYNQLITERFAEALNRIGIEAGSPTVADYVDNNTLFTDSDINFFEMWIGSQNNANDEALRAMYYKMSTAKREVAQRAYKKGKEIVQSQSKVKNGWFKSPTEGFFEMDKDGRKTGYLVRNRNYGEFKQMQHDYMDDLRKEFGLDGWQEVPQDNDEFIRYNKRKNEFQSKYAERAFTPEYYDVYSDMTYNSYVARQEIQDAINRTLQKATKENDIPNLLKLDDKAWDNLQKLYRQKRNLTSPFDEMGYRKPAHDLEIANNLKSINDRLQEKLFWKTNNTKFEQARRQAQLDLTPEQYNKWIDRNSREQYSDKFWKALDKIEKQDYGEEYNRLYGERKELFSTYRLLNKMDLDVRSMPDNVRDYIKHIDKRLTEIRSETPRIITSEKFSDIAEMVTTREYEIAKHTALGKSLAKGTTTGTTSDFYEKWYNANHYTLPNGKQTPYSYWLKIVPKDKKLIEQVPSSVWSEIDPESEFYNKNYDRTDPSYVQPKKEYFDNTDAYNKIVSDPNRKELYDKLLQTMKEANQKLAFRQHHDDYKLPQISGGLFQYIKNNGVLKGLKEYTLDQVSIKTDDTDFNQDTIKRPDGSKLYFIPTHYLNPLKDVNNMTNDLSGAVIAYYEMAQNFDVMNTLAPDMEIIREQLGNRKYNKTKSPISNKLGKSGELIEGRDTNTYKKAEKFLNMNLYGEKVSEWGTWKSGDRRYSPSKILRILRNWATTVNLGWNLTVASVSFTTGLHQALLEAITGRYYGGREFAKGYIQVVKDLGFMILNWGNPNVNNKTSALLQLNQIAQQNTEAFSNLNRTYLQRFLGQHLFYGGLSGGDFIVKGGILSSMYFNYKLVTDPISGEKVFMGKHEFYEKMKQQGRTKNDSKTAWRSYSEDLYSAYDVVNGEAVVKDSHKAYVTDKVKNEIFNTSRYFAAKADGVLTDLDRTFIHANVFGSFLTMHRNFLVINIQDRVTKQKQFNYQTGHTEEGIYRSLPRSINHYFRVLANTLTPANLQVNDIDASDKANFKKAVLEVALMFAYWLMSQYWDEEADDWDSNWLTQEIAYSAKRHLFEVRAQYLPWDVWSIIKTPSAAIGSIEHMINILLSAWIPNWFDEDNNSLKQIERGPYEDYNRLQKSLWKITPAKHIIEHQDPNLKRKYLENMVM